MLNRFSRQEKRGDGLSQRDREIMAVKKHMRRSDTVAAILAILSAIFCYAENEDFYATKYDEFGNVIKAHNVSSTAGTVLRVIIIGLTFFLCKLLWVTIHMQHVIM